MIRLKDNKLSSFSGASKNNLTFQQAGIHCSPPADQSGCSALVGSKSSIPSSAPYAEYLHASQVLLYNVWGTRISDSAEVDDVRQKQCYKPHEQTRFSLNKSAPANDCVSNNKITSPIMSLEWQFSADPYGFGVCCSSGNPTGKDFCATANVKGRMDPIMAGGLPFLHSIDFIRIGEFNISERVVVPSMNATNSNVDGMFFEPSNTGPCPLAPPPAILPPVGNAPAIILPTSPPPPNPTNSSSGSSEPPVTPDPPPPVGPSPYTPPFNPDCPWGYKLSTINKQDKNSLDYTCDPCPARGGLINKFCSGNDVVSNFQDGNCGSYSQTTQSCSNGCSNATCSPPPPPPPPPAPPSPPAGPANAQCAAYKEKINQAIAQVKADYEDCLRPSAKNYYTTCLASVSAKGSIYQTFKTAAIGTKSIDGFGEGGGTFNSYYACTKDGCVNSLFHWSGTSIVAGARVVGFARTDVSDNSGIFYRGNEPECLALLDLIALNANMMGRIATPIVISLEVKSAPPKLNLNGVQFKFFNTLKSDLITWPDFSNPRIGFLVVDLNKNGLIDNSEELFGNMTAGKHFSNGYEALSALYDLNKDGKIDSSEMKDLLFWNDKNQNGISEKSELKNIGQLGVVNIFLDKQHIQFKQVRIPGGQIFPSGEGNVQVNSKGKVYSANSWDLWLEEIK